VQCYEDWAAGVFYRNIIKGSSHECAVATVPQVLVASDVASRGLDIRGLPYVVQYDFPSNLETYIHRVGRTGRLAAQGHAYAFFTRSLVSFSQGSLR
jgi:ERCC4-related helicase